MGAQPGQLVLHATAPEVLKLVDVDGDGDGGAQGGTISRDADVGMEQGTRNGR